MHENDPAVSIEELRHLVNAALDSLHERTGDIVELDEEYFWSIPPESQYDTATPPEAEELTLGQLSENWTNLTRLRATGDTVPTYALVWLADLLRVLGHQAP